MIPGKCSLTVSGMHGSEHVPLALEWEVRQELLLECFTPHPDDKTDSQCLRLDSAVPGTHAPSLD